MCPNKMVMAKTKKSTSLNPANELVKELADTEFIKNPLVFSQISGDFTPMQTNLMVEMIGSLQSRIDDYLRQSKKDDEIAPMLFTREELTGGVMKFSIPMRELGVSPKSYQELEDACYRLLKMNMTYRVRDEVTGEDKKVMANIFSRIEFPTSEITREGTRYQYRGGQRRTGVVDIHLLTENVQQVFDMRRGYVEQVRHIVSFCHRKQSPRVYIYLCRWKGVGHKVVNYLEFKEFLGLLQYSQNRKDIIVNKYDKFSMFTKMVLNPIRDELNQLAEENKIDFSFDYQPVYTKGKKKGDPESLLFEIHLSKMGQSRKDKSAGRRKRSDIEEVLKTEFSLTDTDIISLREMITDDRMLTPLLHELDNMRQKVELYKPMSVKAYVTQSLRNFLRKLSLTLEPIEEAEVVQTDKVQEDPETLRPVLTDSQLNAWNLFIDVMRDTIGDKETDTWFSMTELWDFKDNMVTIKIPDPMVAQHIEENLLDDVRLALEAAFGDGVRLQYKV